MKFYAEFDQDGNKIDRTYFQDDGRVIQTREDILRYWGSRFSKGKIPYVFTPENIVAEADMSDYLTASVVYCALCALCGWCYGTGYRGAIVGGIIGLTIGYVAAYFANKVELKRTETFNKSITPNSYEQQRRKTS